MCDCYCYKTRREAEAEATPMFLLPRPRRDLPFVLAPMSRRLSPRETAPPRRRRRDQPRPSSERCRAATMRRRRLCDETNFTVLLISPSNRHYDTQV